jgi:probable F420-dependent oxidoreductase
VPGHRPLRVGIQLPEVEREVRWPEYVAMAQRAEDVGFDTLWLGDHLLYRWPGREPRGPWEAWTMLAALAASTSRIRLGPLVASTAFHAPQMLAKLAATVDEVSGGRLVLGLGAGWNETEFAAFGFPFDHRIDRFEEAFTIIRTLLREGAIDFDGRYYQARDCELLPRPAKPGGPPLLIGSNGPRMLRIAMPHVDAWNSWYSDTGNSPAGVPGLLSGVDEACRDVGRDPGEVERTIAVHVRLPGGTGRVMGESSKSATIPAVTGDADTIAEELRAYARLGIAEVQLVVDPITLASIDALAPVLEALSAG